MTNRRIGVILSYVMMVLEALSSLLLTPFIIRTLGQAEYGVFQLSVSITAYLLLLDLGVGNAVTRYIAMYRTTNNKESERLFFGLTLIFYLIMAIVSVVIGAFIIYLFPQVFAKGLTTGEIALAQKLLGITVLNAAVTIGTTVFNNIIIGYEKFAVSKGISIAQIIARVILTILAIAFNLGSFGIICANFATTLFGRCVCVSYVLLRLKLRPRLKGMNRKFAIEVVSYSSWVMLQMIATQINTSIDQVLIGSLVVASSTIVAVYSVGLLVVQYFQSIGSAFNSVLMPGVVTMMTKGIDGSRVTNEMLRIGRMIFMVVGLIFAGFLLFGKDFIVLWAGQANEQAYYVTALLMLPSLLILVQSIGTQILWAINEHKELAILQFVIVVANIGLSVVLIKWSPLIGAALGTFISLIVGNVILMNCVFTKKLGFQVKVYFKGLLQGILPSLLFASTIGLCVKLIMPMNAWLPLLIGIFTMTIAYVVIIWHIGMNGYEKELVLDMTRKINTK